jgi:HSP20 family protein
MAPISLLPSVEAADLADDIRRLVEELSRSLPREHRVYSGECHPTLDVLETDEAVEISVDVAGVPPDAVRVLFRANVLLIVGEKAPLRGDGDQTYHLVEREFGRFVRAIRLSGAFDVAKASATLQDGELTVVLPKLEDRRGAARRIPVESGTAPRT